MAYPVAGSISRMTIGDAKVLVTSEAFYWRKVEAWRKDLPKLQHVFLRVSNGHAGALFLAEIGRLPEEPEKL